jgi:hypothetical protein
MALQANISNAQLSSVQPIRRFGQSNGKATVNLNDAQGTSFSYSWSSGSNISSSTTQSITGLAPGTQTVTVTEGSRYTTCAVTITEILPLEAYFRTSSVSPGYQVSNGVKDGEILTLVFNGRPPYSYNWSGPSKAKGANPKKLGQGAYFLEVTDDDGTVVKLGPMNLREQP